MEGETAAVMNVNMTCVECIHGRMLELALRVGQQRQIDVYGVDFWSNLDIQRHEFMKETLTLICEDV